MNAIDKRGVYMRSLIVRAVTLAAIPPLLGFLWGIAVVQNVKGRLGWN